MARTITLEIPGCFETRLTAGLPLSTDEFLLVVIEFLKVMHQSRDGTPLDDDGRFILGAMALELSRLLRPPEALGPNVVPLPRRPK